MFDHEATLKCYQALLDKNEAYEGVFYLGVTTTGVFCRPTCPARKPKFEHCTFYATAQEALLASFRPCLRCRPLSYPNHVSHLVRTLVEAVEADPAKRWKSSDFASLSVNASTAQRQFKKRFGMTFVAYARARRMGLAMDQIRNGSAVIDAQLDAGYESSSGFRDAFTKIMGAVPSHSHLHGTILKASWIDTPLGPMLAIADETALYLLEFVDRRGLEREIERLRIRAKAAIIPGTSDPIRSIEAELKAYFEGTLQEFKTPLHMLGSPFQQLVWNELKHILYGHTKSYLAQARDIDKPTASRAVAGDLGGYGGGLSRKQWLINHEKKHCAP